MNELHLPPAMPVNDGVAAVDRAMLAVSAIGTSSSPITLSELSRRTGLYKSTLLRLLASLQKAALVVQRPDLTYVLGPFAFRLGRAYNVGLPQTQRVGETLERLVAMGTESASFHVRYDDNHRLCLLRVNSRHSTLDNVEAGALLPLDLGAPARIIERFFGGNQPDDDSLTCVSLGECDPGCASIACPVFGADGGLAGAVSLSGPQERFTDESISAMSITLLRECRSLSLALGGYWPG